jgi:hypothetical protein
MDTRLLKQPERSVDLGEVLARESIPDLLGCLLDCLSELHELSMRRL